VNSVQLGQVLTDTVINVFEEAVYALVDREQASCANETLVVESLVSFTGKYVGTIALEVEAAGVLTLINDFLGNETCGSVNNTNSEAVGELANIVAGRLLEAWLPEGTNYDIGIPTVETVKHCETRLVNEPQVCVTNLRTDGGTHVAAAILLGVWS
jgi:CheY-specific phosphatase CheX